MSLCPVPPFAAGMRWSAAEVTPFVDEDGEGGDADLCFGDDVDEAVLDSPCYGRIPAP